MSDNQPTHCQLCTQQLQPTEQATCLRCVARTRADLTDIANAYNALPDELQHHANASIPGGDALVMLAAGSTGIAQERAYRTGHDYSHDEDEIEGEVGSVAFELTRMEDDWRHVRHDPAAVTSAPRHRGDERDRQRREADAALRYLHRWLGWAADHHPGFPDFVADVRRLRGQVLAATARGEWPLYGARCQYDDVPLVRAYAPPKQCSHGPRPAYKRARDQDTGELEPAADALERWLIALEAWEDQHEHCDQGGLTKQWRCPDCARTYTAEEYRLALRRQAGTSVGWMPVHLAADLAGVPEKTLRTWVERGQVGAFCGVRWHEDRAVRSGPLMVAWADLLLRIAMRRVA